MDALKKAAAAAAVELVSSHSLLGLGSGSTLAFFIELLGERIRAGKLQVVGVPTSYQTRLLARQHGVPIRDAIDVDHVDLTVDGADEIDPAGNLIKGAGGAHVLEKLVAACADRFVIVADESKLVRTLGEKFPVPVEVIAPAVPFVLRRLKALGGEPSLRCGKGKLGPIISDLGNPIIDVKFGPIRDVEKLNHALDRLPGVVGHGLFLDMTSDVIVAKAPENDPVLERRSFLKQPRP
ncbi:MAG: ribose-5-phosphate isomerase RpiA [Deltaproteobacteria bacterium]|nr:ribose-5-phosphate isomerase RpiA [Deltaproteobacteria bacterium]